MLQKTVKLQLSRELVLLGKDSFTHIWHLYVFQFADITTDSDTDKRTK